MLETSKELTHTITVPDSNNHTNIKSKKLLFAFVVGGLGFEFCVFIAGWRHALRSEWPFTIIIKEVAHLEIMLNPNLR